MPELLIDSARAQALLGQPGWLAFDLRHDLMTPGAGRAAYQAGHIPGAVHLDQDTDLCAPVTGRNGRHPLPSRDDFIAFMRAQGVSPSTGVVLYDDGPGMYSARLWWMLRWAGHDPALIRILDGGWAAWQADGGPIETASPARQPAGGSAPAAAAAPGMPSVDADDLLANLGSGKLLVIDARAPERYRGDTEPIDPVAGHIPGAANRPFNANLQADQRFRPAQALRADFLALLAGRDPSTVVHQCGSGITACHNLLAMELAGLHGSRLYPGSWSEWCSDPARPVATGA